MFGALLRAARLRSRGLQQRLAVAKPPMRGQRYRLFRRRAHRRFRFVVIVTVASVVVELFVVVVVFGLAHRSLSAVRLAPVLAGTAALAVTVHVAVVVCRVHVVRDACKTILRTTIIFYHSDNR